MNFLISRLPLLHHHSELRACSQGAPWPDGNLWAGHQSGRHAQTGLQENWHRVLHLLHRSHVRLSETQREETGLYILLPTKLYQMVRTIIKSRQRLMNFTSELFIVSNFGIGIHKYYYLQAQLSIALLNYILR